MTSIHKSGVRRTGLFVCLLATLGMSSIGSTVFGQGAVEPTPLRAPDAPQDKQPEGKENKDPKAQPAAPGGVVQPVPVPAQGGPAKARRASKKSPKKVAWLEIEGQLRDGPPPFRLIPTDEGPKSLRRVIDRMAELARDKSVTGAVVYLNQPDLGMSQVDELGRAITAFRASGKRVIVFAEAYDLHTYLLATYADRITVLKNGEIGISGLSMEEMYLAGLFEKIGAKADYIQIGKFKGAEEPMTRTGPTAEWSKTIDGVLDDMYAQFIQRVATSRKKTPQEVEKFFGECWKMSADDYAKEKWVDAVVDRGMVEETETVFGTEFEYFDLLEKKSAQQPESPFALMQMLTQPVPKTVARNSIAVINAQGAIGSGRSESKFRAGLFNEASIGSQSLEEALIDAKNEPMIVGVVIRINSPGGSALASEVIWQAVRTVQENKPVFISINGMAASGGYYIACAGEKIYVLPSSIVGSIGVVGGKVTFGGLYEKLGVSVFRRNRGPNADIFNSVTGFTPQQSEMLKAAMQRTYALFVDRVKSGRGAKIANVDDVAQGRLFSGKQAVENGLADKIGGLSTAVDDMAKQLNLASGSYDVIQWPRASTLAEYLNQIMTGMAAADMASQDQAAAAKTPILLLRAVIGERSWRSVAPVANGMMLMSDEHVLTLLPVALTVK
jgi:protease IV